MQPKMYEHAPLSFSSGYLLNKSAKTKLVRSEWEKWKLERLIGWFANIAWHCC
jgi:hypothetical protein